MSKKYFSSRRLTSICTRRRGKSPDRHTQVCRGAFDEVSKNVFTEPFERLGEFLCNVFVFSTCQNRHSPHFCGAWVYRQSETALQKQGGLFLSFFTEVIDAAGRRLSVFLGLTYAGDNKHQSSDCKRQHIINCTGQSDNVLGNVIFQHAARTENEGAENGTERTPLCENNQRYRVPSCSSRRRRRR